MTNYEKALKIEEEYLSLLTKRVEKDNFKLHEKLGELGFTVESFQEEKCNRFFEGKNVTVKDTNEYDTVNDINYALINKIDTCLFGINSQPSVYVSNDDSSYNKSYCISNNIPIIPIGYGGGAIITSNQDLGIALILKDSLNLISFLLKKLNYIFNSKNIQTTISGNDLLLDDHKVVGSAYKTFENMTAHCFQISMHVDINLINNISTKPIIKIPGGISDLNYNLTRDDIKNEVLKWLR